jgi:RNA polymerase sigma-70 factor (ECF subfamily)
MQPPTLPSKPEHSFDGLVTSHRAAFERLARRLARDPEDAEDLLQETLVDAYRAFGNFRADSHFYSWVARIMTNNHLDRIRRRRVPAISLDQASAEDGEAIELPDETANPERLLLHEQLDHRYASALEALQPLQRVTVLLCDLEGATYEEAARMEACPIGTIRSRLHRAHRAIKEFLVSLNPGSVPEPQSARIHSRRAFLRMGTAAAAAAGAALTQLPGADEADAAERPVRVLVWCDEPGPTEAYREGIAQALAAGVLAEGVVVRTASLSDPDQGLDERTMAETDVLLWWADSRHAEVADERARAVARRVREGRMGLIAVHGAEGSQPFRLLLGTEGVPDREASPAAAPLPLRVAAPRHPIASGISSFTVPGAARGGADLPRPEFVVFDHVPAAGEQPSWQGMTFRPGAGRVFVFRPGDPAHPVFRQEAVRRVLQNAVGWCAGRQGS